MKGIFIYFTLLFILMPSNSFGSKDFIFISNNVLAKSEKEAILILPGFGSKIQGTDSIIAFFIKTGYDVYIPNYISRKSIANCVTNLDEFIIKNDLASYSKLNVFSYIVGAWTLNNWILKNPKNNIHSIVYDRSPLQERAPYALVTDIPVIIRLFSGKIMKEFSKTPYLPISNSQINIGVFIENRATKLIKKHKKTAMSLGSIDWNPKELKQVYSDFCYLPLNHDDLYNRFEIFGGEIIYFFKYNAFSSDAKRTHFSEDPFINFEKK